MTTKRAETPTPPLDRGAFPLEQIALVLSRLTATEWAAERDEDADRWGAVGMLRDATHLVVVRPNSNRADRVDLGFTPAQLVASGAADDDAAGYALYGVPQRIQVRWDRGPDVIAREIATRLLPMVAPWIEKMVRRTRATRRLRAHQQTVHARLIAASGGLVAETPSRSGDDSPYSSRLTETRGWDGRRPLPPSVDLVVHQTMEGPAGIDTEQEITARVRLTFDRVSVEMAEVLLAYYRTLGGLEKE